MHQLKFLLIDVNRVHIVPFLHIQFNRYFSAMTIRLIVKQASPSFTLQKNKLTILFITTRLVIINYKALQPNNQLRSSRQRPLTPTYNISNNRTRATHRHTKTSSQSTTRRLNRRTVCNISIILISISLRRLLGNNSKDPHQRLPLTFTSLLKLKVLHTIILILGFTSSLLSNILSNSRSNSTTMFISSSHRVLPNLLRNIRRIVRQLQLKGRRQLPSGKNSVTLQNNKVRHHNTRNILRVHRTSRVISIITSRQRTKRAKPKTRARRINGYNHTIRTSRINTERRSLTNRHLQRHRRITRRLKSFQVRVVNLRRTISNNAPLFRLGLLRLLIIKRIQLLKTALLTLLLTHLHGQHSHNNRPSRSHRVRRSISQLTNSHKPQTSRRQSSTSSRHRRRTTRRLRPSQHVGRQHRTHRRRTIRRITYSTRRHTTTQNNVPINSRPLRNVSLTSLLRPSRLTHLNINLRFRSLIIRSYPYSTPSHAFHNNRTRQRPSRRYNSSSRHSGRSGHKHVNRQREGPSFRFVYSTPIATLPPGNSKGEHIVPLSTIHHHTAHHVQRTHQPHPSTV